MLQFFGICFSISLLLLHNESNATDILQQESYYHLGKKAAVVVVVKRTGKQGLEWSGGSGVLIDSKKGFVLTAKHNIEPRIASSKISCFFFHDEKTSRQLMPDEVTKLSATTDSTCTIVEENESLDIVFTSTGSCACWY